MSLFERRVERKEFDELKSEINNKINFLTEEIQRKATDSEESARAAADNAIEIEGKIRNTEANVNNALKNLEEYKSQALLEVQAIQSERKELTETNTKLITNIKENQDLHTQLIKSKESTTLAVSEISENFEKIKSLLTEAEELPSAVTSTKKLVEEAEELNEKLQNLLTHSMKRKSEIDELHKQIYGHDVRDSAGAVEHIDGIKDHLDATYTNLEERSKDLESSIQSLTSDITDKHKTLLNKQKDLFENLVSESKSRITSINEQITNLLPGAMAAGLSAAYENKKTEETETLKKFEKTFKASILGLISVSLIPFAVDIYLLAWQSKDIIQLIKDTPNLIISILPLYFPVLWLAYSTNKKINLSKRLIEEYTHKAVLGKTFSGLSNQIDKLPQEESLKEDLRTRLLFNVMQVSAENPGKLITNYNKSDHPLMEALENSAKLSDSVESLAKIPGLSVLAQKLSERSDEFLRAQQQKIEKGFATQEILESPENIKS